MAIRLRKKKLIYSGLIGAAGMLILCSAGGFFWYQHAEEKEIELKQEYRTQVKELESVAAQSQYAYALANDVKKGEAIVEGDLQMVYLPEAGASSDLFLYNLIDDSQKTYYAKTDLPAKTILTDSLLYEDVMITKDIREAEYAFIDLPTKIAKEQYIDVRIQFPSGDDYIVLSKKKVKDVLGLTIWMDVEEGEILTMSSAMVDAYVEGALIYAVPYVDEHMQDGAEMTYPVKANVKELIQESPNIVNEAKLNLERQNRARLDNTLNATDDGDKSKVGAGVSDTQSKVQQDEHQRTTEERVNAANAVSAEINQQEILGGGEEE